MVFVYLILAWLVLWAIGWLVNIIRAVMTHRRYVEKMTLICRQVSQRETDDIVERLNFIEPILSEQSVEIVQEFRLMREPDDHSITSHIKSDTEYRRSNRKRPSRSKRSTRPYKR